VRLVGDDAYEVSPHKTDLAMQVRAPAEPGTGAPGEMMTPTRPAGALRFRSGTVTGRPVSSLPMVGVVNLGGATPKAEVVAAAAPVEAPAATPAKSKAPAAKAKSVKAAKKTAKSTSTAKKAAAKPAAKSAAKKAAPAAKETAPPAKAGKAVKSVKKAAKKK
jgi:hypothetical protein